MSASASVDSGVPDSRARILNAVDTATDSISTLCCDDKVQGRAAEDELAKSGARQREPHAALRLDRFTNRAGQPERSAGHVEPGAVRHGVDGVELALEVGAPELLEGNGHWMQCK